MQTFINGLKPLFIKHMAIFMTICYALNLFQHQINPILHTLTHSFEAPVGLISHETISNNDYEIHGHYDHKIANTTHEHKILNFIDSLFNKNDKEDHREDSILVESKVDKHLTKEHYKKQPFCEYQNLQNYCEIVKKSNKGYPHRNEQPPKFV